MIKFFLQVFGVYLMMIICLIKCWDYEKVIEENVLFCLDWL